MHMWMLMCIMNHDHTTFDFRVKRGNLKWKNAVSIVLLCLSSLTSALVNTSGGECGHEPACIFPDRAAVPLTCCSSDCSCASAALTRKGYHQDPPSAGVGVYPELVRKPSQAVGIGCCPGGLGFCLWPVCRTCVLWSYTLKHKHTHSEPRGAVIYRRPSEDL